ncbi:hypothetical protein RND81_01G041000 [Saponaria officinalis]|uniref:C2H2-type domain-containing protein n=1 Tax=Saponaria officinalis TaxID=3572 RepID=A0AAW1NCK8_SAPOF
MNFQGEIGDGFSIPSTIRGFSLQQHELLNPNNPNNPKANNNSNNNSTNNNSSNNNNNNPQARKKRNLPDPDAEVIALSPKTLMATNRFICEICNKGFQRDQNLQLHRRGHNLPWKLKQRTNKEVKKKVYICPEKTCVHHDPCRALGDLTGIKKHFSRKHGEKKWKCEKCSKKYAVQSDWKAHSKTCGTREYKCDCGTLFSRKDSFITHRAFCDALAEENSRVTTVTPSSLSFKTDTMNNNSALNIQAAYNNNHELVSQGLQDHANVGISPFTSLFRADFNSMAGGNPLNAGLPEMMQMATANLFNSSSIPNFAMNNPFSILDRSSATPSTSTHANLSLSSFATGLKDEGAHNNNRQNMAETLGSMFSNDHNKSSPSSTSLTPMSATALLQKAAQMGSTRSNNAPFFGTSTSNNSNAVQATPASTAGGPGTGAGGSGGIRVSGSSNLATPVRDISQLMMQGSRAKSQNESSQHVVVQSNSNRVESDLTRDFLGITAGDESGHQILPQELADFASMSSNMRFNHFGDK